MALDFAKGDDFAKKIKSYMLPYFRKGIPSLFSEIKHLYSGTGNAEIIENVLLTNLVCLEKESKFADSEKIESPCCLLWDYMLLAQHYDRINQLDKALEFVNKAISHTPTLIELYLVKAKIYKHKFDHKVAFELTEKVKTIAKLHHTNLKSYEGEINGFGRQILEQQGDKVCAQMWVGGTGK